MLLPTAEKAHCLHKPWVAALLNQGLSAAAELQGDSVFPRGPMGWEESGGFVRAAATAATEEKPCRGGEAVLL